MGFLGDLNFGQVSEQVIMDKLREQFPDVLSVNTADCDIEVPIKIEIKRERAVMKYKNVAVELAYKEKPSGPFSSLADIWIWDINGSFFWTYRQELLRWLATHEDKYVVKMGGDGKNSKLALINIVTFVTEVASKFTI